MYAAYIGGSDLTAQFGSAPALKKQFVVNFCKSSVTLAVIAGQINWDML